MSARLCEIARTTERIVAEGAYVAPDGQTVEIAEEIARARRGTRLYGPGPVAVPEPRPAGGGAGAGTVFEVTAEGSLDASRRLAADGPVAVLN